LNRIPYPWTHLGSDITHPGLDTSLLELKVLIPIRSCFLNLLLEFTQTTYPGSLHPIGLPESRPNSLSGLHPSVLPEPYPIASMLTRPYKSIPGRSPYPILLLIELLLTQSYTVLPGRITLPDLFSIGLRPTRSYPATVPDFLARLGNTSLHPTAYPALPDHLARLGTLQLNSPKNFLIGLPP
jgi:hypothetical protein